MVCPYLAHPELLFYSLAIIRTIHGIDDLYFASFSGSLSFACAECVHLMSLASYQYGDTIPIPRSARIHGRSLLIPCNWVVEPSSCEILVFVFILTLSLIAFIL